MSKMRKFINNIYSLTANLFVKEDKAEIERSIRVHEWNSMRGDITYRLNYNLSKSSIIFDIGGYVGQWTSDIYSRYQSKIYVFEPVDEYYKFIKNRFEYNSDIYVIHAGLGSRDRYENINIYNENSSTYDHGKSKISKSEKIRIIDIKKYIDNQKISHIDLMKINIEGAEYEVLEYILESELVNIIENIQIQFHSFVPDAYSKRKLIRRTLKKTHKLTYDFPFIWENWQKIA